MHHLYTTHGTLVFLDEATGRLRHGPIADAPANLAIEHLGGTVSLTHQGRPVAAFGTETCGLGDEAVAPRALRELRRGAAQSSFHADGRYLAAEPEGSISFVHTMPLDHETFFLLTPAECSDLKHLMSSRWITSAGRRVLATDEITALPQFAVRIRQSEFALENLLTQLRPPGATPLAERGTVKLRSDGWHLDWLHRFRPLAYLTAFGSEEAFAGALTTIGSLLRFGRWPGDILLITDAAHRGIARNLPPELTRRLHVAAVQADDPLDRAFARYRIPDLAVAANYQPILYLGSGVVCDAPLDGLLAGLALSERLHTLPERPLLGADDAYGRTLFLRDGYRDEGNAIGFSTTLLGFRSVHDVRDLFATIVECGYGFAEQEQSRAFFATHDQAFANYVMHKVGVFDLSLIYACMSTPPTETALATTKGLLRMVAPDGNPAVVLAGMRNYIDTIGKT